MIKYNLRLFNGEPVPDSTKERLSFLQSINEDFELYPTEVVTSDRKTLTELNTDYRDLNYYFKTCDDERNCLCFIHSSEFPDIETYIGNWNDKYRDHLFVVLFSNLQMPDSIRGKILEKAAAVNFDKHIFTIQKTFDSVKPNKNKLREFVDAFIDYSTTGKKTIDDLHDIFKELNDDYETDYLIALNLLCKGFLTIHVLNDEKLLQNEEIKKAVKNMGIDKIINKDFLKNLKVEIENVNSRNYWTDVFDNIDECEERLKNEWKELTKNEEISEGLHEFIIYLKSDSQNISYNKVALIYNEIYSKLKINYD